MARFIILAGSNRSHMEQYISEHGYHFNKGLCDFAVSLMKDRRGKIEPWSREQVETLLSRHGMAVDTSNHDFVYVANMVKADYFGSSIPDDTLAAKYICDTLSDPDQAEGFIFARFLSDCRMNGVEIPWHEFI